MSQPIFSDGLGYEGKVTLTLKSNNRVLKSKTYKNNGTAQLFKFLGYCLIDSYEEAKKLLPWKIMLLQNNSSGEDETLVTHKSGWHTFAKMPVITSTGGDNTTAQVKVIYSFEIPRVDIEGGFNQVALYGVQANDPKDFSAFYYLTDAYGELELQEPANWSDTTVLLIEWELSLSNKNLEVTNSQGGLGIK